MRARHVVPFLLLAGAPGCFRFDVELLPNAPPQAVVEPELTAEVGAEVVLDGATSTDTDGDALTFEWAQESGAPVSLRNARTAVVAFTAPPEPQALYFTLIVDDGATRSVPAVVRVNVTLPQNAPPLARVAAETLTAVPGATVVLDASTSTDPDPDDTLTFAWEVIEGAGGFVALTDADRAVANFRAPATVAAALRSRVYANAFVKTGAERRRLPERGADRRGRAQRRLRDRLQRERRGLVGEPRRPVPARERGGRRLPAQRGHDERLHRRRPPRASLAGVAPTFDLFDSPRVTDADTLDLGAHEAE